MGIRTTNCLLCGQTVVDKYLNHKHDSMKNSVAIHYTWLNRWYERRDFILHILLGCFCWLWVYSSRQLSHNHLASISAIKLTAVNILLNQHKNPHAPISTCNHEIVPLKFPLAVPRYFGGAVLYPYRENVAKNDWTSFLNLVVHTYHYIALCIVYFTLHISLCIAFCVLYSVYCTGRGVTKPPQTKKRTD